MNAWIAAAGICGVLVLGLMFQEWRIDRLKTKAAGWEVAVTEYQDSVAKHEKALNVCKVVAQENLDEAERQRQAVQDAVIRVSNLRQRLSDGLQVVFDQGETLNEEIEQDCAAAIDPAFVDSLYNSP